MSTQRKNNIMLDFQIFRICQVFNIKEFFHFMNTLFRQVYDFIFFIYDKVTGLDDFLTHDSCHLGHFTTGFSAL